MGLTRYWSRPPSLDVEQFRLWAEDCRSILHTASFPQGSRQGPDRHDEETYLTLRGPGGTGDPEVSDRCVAFNGDLLCGADHEPFVMERDVQPVPGRLRQGRVTAYCKTAGKPYDRAVDACLIALRRRFQDAVTVEVDAAGADLTAGRVLHDSALGHDG